MDLKLGDISSISQKTNDSSYPDNYYAIGGANQLTVKNPEGALSITLAKGTSETASTVILDKTHITKAIEITAADATTIYKYYNTVSISNVLGINGEAQYTKYAIISQNLLLLEHNLNLNKLVQVNESLKSLAMETLTQLRDYLIILQHFLNLLQLMGNLNLLY